MRLADRMMEPPGRWVLKEIPETKWDGARGGNFQELVRVVREHYSANGVICADVEQRVEQLLCDQLRAGGYTNFLVPDPVAPPMPKIVSASKSKTLTIAYITNRRDCKIEWFLDSLVRQGGFRHPVTLVDFYRKERPTPFGVDVHVSPKPNVWSGPHRLTSVNYFTAANSRNTALCLCRTDWIAFVDDLSVLMPGWLNSIYQAMEENYIVFGSYRKVRELKVLNGEVQSCIEYPTGMDNRMAHTQAELTSCGGNWLFGCSFATPLEALLDVGGSPEMCDSTGGGGEDYCLGIALANRGNAFRYDRRMLTFESEEHHHTALPFKRMDKGVSPNDKSHSMLAIAQQTSCYDPNLRALRERVLAGEPFPIPTEPRFDWFDNQPLSEL